MQVARQVVKAVVVPVARDLAAAVAAVVERDHPVVGGQVGNLVGPHTQRAGNAVAEHDRIAIVGAEDLSVCRRVPSAARTMIARPFGRSAIPFEDLVRVTR